MTPSAMFRRVKSGSSFRVFVSRFSWLGFPLHHEMHKTRHENARKELSASDRFGCAKMTGG